MQTTFSRHLMLLIGAIWMVAWGCRMPDADNHDKATDTPKTQTDTPGHKIYDLRTEYQESFPKYIKRDAEFSGLCIDILHALEQESGLRIGAAVPEFTPFKRIQRHLENGEIDLFVGMKKTEVRADRYVFLERPIYTVASVIAVHNGSAARIRKVEDLFGHTVMVPDGAATASEIRGLYPAIMVDEGADIFGCLNKLLQTRHEYVIYHDIGLYGAIREMGLQDEITVLPLILDRYDHYVAVSRQTPDETRKRLDDALIRLDKQGRLRAIQTRYAPLPGISIK